MKIALCMITKGDEELDSLKICLDSIKDYVDSVHITCNSDKVEKTSKWVISNGWDYSFRKWSDDFSDQRNFNWSRVPTDTDYIFWLDTDDTLIGGEYLRPLAELAKSQNYDAVFLQYWYGCLFKKNKHQTPESLLDVELHHYRERLVRPGKITWKKRIHETPIPVDGAKYKYNRINHLLDKPDKKFPIAVMHRGADRDLSAESLEKRQQRNKKLLELSLEDERKDGEADPRTILYLMKVYADGDVPEEWAKVLVLGKEYLDKSGWDEERAVCAMQMAIAFGKRGSNDAAAKILHSALAEWPHNPLIHLMLSEAYYNMGQYRQMEFWLKSGLNLDVDESSASMQNVLQMKMLSTQLLLRLYFNVKKDINKAYEAAKTLFTLDPSIETKTTMDEVEKLKLLNDACRNADELATYYKEQEYIDRLVKFIDSLPKEMAERPFFIRLKNKYKSPKIWGEKEICYYATFGGEHFEKWSPKSLGRGVGGSETAVIELAKEWTKLGYKVTVYGDPGEEAGEYDGVTYKSFNEFNRRDHFNIFIQWRAGYLAGKIKAKKFYIDLHDVWNPVDYKNLDAIDGFMVKSEYHRNLGHSIPANKFNVISNGIRA